MIVSNNVITDTGLDSSGAARANASLCPAIKVEGSSRSIDISHNTIIGSEGPGILLYAGTSGSMEKITAGFNTISGAKDSAIYVWSEYYPSVWAQNTVYAAGSKIRNDNGKFYSLRTPGTSASSGAGPTGTGLTITDGTCVWHYSGGYNERAVAYAGSTTYAAGAVVYRLNNYYLALNGGTTAASGSEPSGTNTITVDGGVTWQHDGPFGVQNITLEGNKCYMGTLDIAAIRLRANSGGTYNNVNILGGRLVSNCTLGSSPNAIGILSSTEFDGIVGGGLEIRGFDAGTVFATRDLSTRPLVSEVTIQDCRIAHGHSGGVNVRPYGSRLLGPKSQLMTDGAQPGGRIVTTYTDYPQPVQEWVQDTRPTIATSTPGNVARLGRSQQVGIAGWLDAFWGWLPIHWDVPVRPIAGNASVANAGTYALTLSECAPGFSELWEMTYRFRVGVSAAPNWAAGAYKVWIQRDASGAAYIISEGHDGPVPTGWTFTSSISSGSPVMTLTNGTGATRGAYLEPTARKTLLT